MYLAKLKTGTTAKESYMIFTVREDSRASDLYFQNSVNTWQAYNPWGGNSFYPYPRINGCGTNVNCAACSEWATQLSFNRPYSGQACWSPLSYGTGAGEFFVFINAETRPGWECNALRWIERQGYNVTYCTDIDTHDASSPGCLLNKSVKAFLVVGHDEYWSQGMRTNVESARDRTNSPINLMFIAGNTCWWRSGISNALRTVVCNKL